MREEVAGTLDRRLSMELDLCLKQRTVMACKAFANRCSSHEIIWLVGHLTQTIWLPDSCILQQGNFADACHFVVGGSGQLLVQGSTREKSMTQVNNEPEKVEVEVEQLGIGDQYGAGELLGIGLTGMYDCSFFAIAFMELVTLDAPDFIELVRSNASLSTYFDRIERKRAQERAAVMRLHRSRLKKTGDASPLPPGGKKTGEHRSTDFAPAVYRRNQANQLSLVHPDELEDMAAL